MNYRYIIALVLAFAVLLGLDAQSSGTDFSEMPGQAQLSVDEAEGLLLMREEEKLARDVYQYLGAEWNIRIFTNIARSEQTHMDRVAQLLSAYGISDPVEPGSPSGDFKNPELAELYETLISRGEVSAYEALLVGKDIEELDIRDLEHLMSETEESDILTVYENLLRGSENHLDAFNRQIDRY